MCGLALHTDKEVPVVGDQIGQPTNVHDLAKQVISLVNSEAKFGTYHGTNAGQASWFEFAREIFRLSGVDKNRVIPAKSSEFLRPAKRPTYSVLDHHAWIESEIAPMRDWKIALEEAFPAILYSIEMQR